MLGWADAGRGEARAAEEVHGAATGAATEEGGEGSPRSRSYTDGIVLLNLICDPK